MTVLPPNLESRLICPRCQGPLLISEGGLNCSRCISDFPLVAGIPILLSNDASVFSANEADRLDEYIFSRTRSGVMTRLRRWLPASATNLYAEGAFVAIGRILAAQFPRRPAVLVLGAGEGGAHLDVLLRVEQADFIRTDVVLGPNVTLVLDAHDIPFEDETFDAVIVQAVLEHVLDPHRCVQEIWRVLKPGALIYAETPFMQQVHGGRYDFTRYTLLGHRRLLRQFTEIDSGIVAGPGAALAWSWEYFLMSFCRTVRSRVIARTLGRMTSFFLKYFDRALVTRPGSFDAASAFGFLGSKAPVGSEITDRALLESYRGLIP